MGAIQQKVGKSFEDEVLSLYHKLNWYATKLKTGTGGTTFDILISKRNRCAMLECKHIKGDKLYYKGSGIYKKRDELDKMLSTENDITIVVKSDTTGYFSQSWSYLKPIFESKGYVEKSDCNAQDILFTTVLYADISK